MIRVFLAVELSLEVRESIVCLQEELRETLPPMNWVRPESIHLTLKFLGDVHPTMISQLLSVLEPIGKTRETFSMEVQGLGVFPHIKHPRVLWVGVTGDMDALNDLVLEIESTLEPLGFPADEKSYHPHLTMARIKRDNANIGSACREAGVLEHHRQLGTLMIDRFSLFQSELSPSGARYTSLGTVPFTTDSSHV